MSKKETTTKLICDNFLLTLQSAHEGVPRKYCLFSFLSNRNRQFQKKTSNQEASKSRNGGLASCIDYLGLWRFLVSSTLPSRFFMEDYTKQIIATFPLIEEKFDLWYRSEIEIEPFVVLVMYPISLN